MILTMITFSMMQKEAHEPLGTMEKQVSTELVFQNSIKSFEKWLEMVFLMQIG